MRNQLSPSFFLTLFRKDYKLVNLDSIKAHVKRHEKAYWIGSLVVVAGVTFVVTRRFVVPKISVSPVFNNTPVFNNDNSSLVNFGGHTTKLVQRTSDGKVWTKVTEAAAEADVSVSYMSRHLHGHNPDVGGEQYIIVGVGTTG